MSAVTIKEVIPSIVIHCDPASLIGQGSCETTAIAGNEVAGPHYFLVLEIDEASQISTCTPLYSGKESHKSSQDWVMLIESEKAGTGKNWTSEETYYFRWQFWHIPIASFQAASADDSSDADARRTYGSKNSGLLTAILANLARAKQPWRALNSN